MAAQTLIQRKVRRLQEACGVAMLGADFASKRQLAGCFTNLGAASRDASEMSLRLRSGASAVPCRMRRSDIFTLKEVFHDRQYEHQAPVPDRPTILDAGANIGLASMWLLGRYPRARIHAFEPASDNHALLLANLGSVPGVVLNKAAVGAQEGEIELQMAKHGAMHRTARGGCQEGPTETVPCLTLAGYLDAHRIGTVDLLKLDVEGAELDAVAGLGERAQDVRVIVGEVHERWVDSDAFHAKLVDLGYRVRRIDFVDGAEEGVHGFEAYRID